jgi:hypothetical protein
MAWFTRANIVQVIVGTWFFMALPNHVQRLFMGQSIFATLTFQAGLVAAALALYAGVKQKIKMATGVTMVLMFIMVMVRDQMRGGYLSSFCRLRDLTVAPEFSPLVFFLACLSLSLTLVVIALKWALAADSAGSQSPSDPIQSSVTGRP